jgi:hypothetical protein
MNAQTLRRVRYQQNFRFAILSVVIGKKQALRKLQDVGSQL